MAAAETTVVAVLLLSSSEMVACGVIVQADRLVSSKQTASYSPKDSATSRCMTAAEPDAHDSMYLRSGSPGPANRTTWAPPPHVELS